MEQSIQTSFIPKKIMVNKPAEPRRPIPLFLTLAIVTFFLAVVFHGVLYGYKIIAERQLGDLKISIERARGAFDPATLGELERTDKKLRSAQDIINRHLTLVPFFKMLDTETLRTVRFKSLTLSAGEGRVDLRMSGEAANYSAIALQSDTFSETKKINGAVFSDLGLDQGGRVVFNMSATVDPSLLSYKEHLGEQNTQ